MPVMTASRVLIVEDEQHIADGLSFNLRAEGHEVVVAADGERALELLLTHVESFDVVVLDVMLPGKDGFTVAAEVRAAGTYVPILMLTARGRPEDVLKGFEAGADDYLPKPFELAILIARLNGLLRRRKWNERDIPAIGTQSDSFAFSGRTIDFSAMEIHARGDSHRLTQMECDLLRYLVQELRPGGLASRDSREGLGSARGYRHTRDRQLHRPAAAVSRGQARLSEISADGPRRGISVRSRGAYARDR